MDRRTTAPSLRITQSKRPGSVGEGVTCSMCGFGVKVIILRIWDATLAPTMGQRAAEHKSLSDHSGSGQGIALART